MIIYVSHCFGGNLDNFERARKITHDLQVNDTENCYICPLVAFSHLGYNEIGYDEEMDLCLDLMTVCDKLLVASEISEGVNREIELAERCNMEIEYIEDTR